jgi:ATP-dependent RNA helicase DHX29
VPQVGTAKKPQGDPGPPSSPSLDPYESDSSLDPDTLVPKFVELQTRLYEIQPDLFDRPKKGNKSKTEGQSSDSRAARIQRKIGSIESDVLFERHEAESLWREKLDGLRKEAAFLRQNPPDESPPEQVESQEPPTEAKEDPEDVLPVDEQADLFGDMFEREEPALEVGVITEELNAAAMTVRDFGKWTGLSPRRILEETCKSKYDAIKAVLCPANEHRRDASCKITYKDISSSSHSNRKAVEVRWPKPQEAPFPLALEDITHKSSPYATFVSMDKIATATAQQAEAFVSTLALFLLFPSTSKEGKSYMRLPAVWRDVWTEFSNVKKLQEDEADKKTIKDLKNLIQENQGSFEDEVVLSDNFRRRNGAAGKPETPAAGRGREEFGPDDRLRNIWAEKASTPSFQRMAQGRMNLPIWSFREEILASLDMHRALIICSETGSGKSTQVPSFILEHEMQQGRPCKIYVTEPRRISAISLARRVSEELGERKNDVGTSRSLIGFAVRLESQVSQATRLAFA